MSEAKNSILILIERGSHMKEVWKPIIGYEGYYEVSNYGYVRTVTRFIANNCLDHLEWVTSSQNIKHAYNIGLKTQAGAKNNSSKLSEQQVMQICDLFKNTTFTNKEIADMFHLKSDETVRRIRKRVSWTHITNNIEF